MRMHFERYGDYEMNNHVVEYAPDRRIGWEPRLGRGHPDVTEPRAAQGRRWICDLLPHRARGHPDVTEPRAAQGRRWICDLLPHRAGATVVTEIFDGSRMPDDQRAEVDSGRAWWQTQVTPPPRASVLEGFSLCRLGVATDQPGS
ncbi:hypothetical protein [Streptomyces sp. NPDC058385]|uniref:hypothetical protein n=1 Tax=Streptomyces sp. NPDC058385 TaxID=3346473 RepID=UPI003652AB75